MKTSPVKRVNLRSQNGGGILDSLMSLGKTIISSPQVQQSAKELASEATSEILKSIKARTQKTQAQQPSTQRNPKIDRLLKGSGLKYID